MCEVHALRLSNFVLPTELKVNSEFAYPDFSYFGNWLYLGVFGKIKKNSLCALMRRIKQLHYFLRYPVQI